MSAPKKNRINTGPLTPLFSSLLENHATNTTSKTIYDHSRSLCSIPRKQERTPIRPAPEKRDASTVMTNNCLHEVQN